MGHDRSEVVEWLLEGDPAIRWQVLRDLENAPESVWEKEQSRVATEGWGARLLEHRAPEGRWTPKLYGKKWISTTYTMVLLRRLGMPRSDPRAVQTCRLFLDGRLVTHPRSDTCVMAMVLAFFYWFGFEDPRRDNLLARLLGRQLPDGGWNCHPSEHGSFHTTISVLEALRECADSATPDAAVAEAEGRGREFFLEHRMFRSHRTGDVVDDRYLRFSFPPRWHYDVLRGLDYFRAAASLEDKRLEEAIEVVERKRHDDWRWLLQQRWPGETWFEMEAVGEPSRWNTLRAMRVLQARQAHI
ncbi:MAG: hypothetical protein ACRDZM_00715 [Acidimicrobiia bacterium]